MDDIEKRLAEVIDALNDCDWRSTNDRDIFQEVLTFIQRARATMLAAAEEISAHWLAHCGADGYGPVNLMRRLEEGMPSDYGYTPGAFRLLQEENERLRKLLYKGSEEALQKLADNAQELGLGY